MEVKSGYKQTEVGVIPEDWELKTLGSLTSLLTNGFVGTATSAYVNSDDSVLYIQGYNVQENGFDFHGIKRVSKTFHARNQKSCLQPGDLLTIQTGDIGVTAVVPAELAGANCHALVISRLSKRVSEPDFYSQYFNSERGRAAFKEIETGSTMKHLNVGDMKRLFLPSPPVEEQRAIAGALSDVDALIGALDSALVKKRNLKQAAMQQLLTGQTRLPGFQGRWEVKRLGECATFRTGPFGSALHKSDYTDDGVPVINPMHINTGQIVPTRTMTITEQAAISLSDFRLKACEIVMGRRGDMGRCAVVQPHQSGWLCGTGSMIIRGGNADANFLQRVLSSPQVIAAIEDTSVGSTMINLNQSTLAGLRVQFPPLPEQTAIAEVLSDMDAELASLTQRRDKTRALKQGMMQELLTGRTRLV